MTVFANILDGDFRVQRRVFSVNAAQCNVMPSFYINTDPQRLTSMKHDPRMDT